jgi:hypothetical protein
MIPVSNHNDDVLVEDSFGVLHVLTICQMESFLQEDKIIMGIKEASS